MSEGLAVELKPFGIGVSIPCPGVVRTNILESARNRPERYGPPTPVDTANPVYASFAERVHWHGPRGGGATSPGRYSQ